MFAKELEERAKRQELRRKASAQSLTPKKNNNHLLKKKQKNVNNNHNKNIEQDLDEDSTDVLDLLNTDDEKDEEDNGEEEEEDMDADSIFLRMDDDNHGDEKIAEEKVKESSNYNNNTSSSNKSNAKKKSVYNNNIESSKDETTSNSPGSFQDKLLRQEQVAAINAQQRSRARTTTTKYDPQQQLAIEFIRRREQACAWIKNIMKQSSSSRREKEALPTSDTFVSALKNGVILCELMRVINGERAAKISIHRQYPPATKQMKERDNIETFLAQCKDVGLDQNSLFETDDLYESSDHDGGGNLGAVLYTLGVLARLAEKNKLITSENMFWHGHGFKNNNFPTRKYSQSEVTKASVALLMMDGDAATPILNFTDKAGRKKSFDNKNKNKDTTLSSDSNGGNLIDNNKKSSNNNNNNDNNNKNEINDNNSNNNNNNNNSKTSSSNYIDHDDETWGSSSDDSDDDDNNGSIRGRTTRGQSVNLKELDESKKDFKKRLELVKRKLIVTQSEIETVDEDAVSDRKRRPSSTLSSLSPAYLRKRTSDGYTSGDEEAGLPACYGTLENEVLVGKNDEATLLSSLYHRNSISINNQRLNSNSNNNKREVTSVQKAKVVISWLIDQGLEEYVTTFQNSGWDDPKTIATLLTEHELLRMGIKKRGHILQLLSNIPKLRRQLRIGDRKSSVSHVEMASSSSNVESTVETLPADLMKMWDGLKTTIKSTNDDDNTTESSSTAKNIKSIENVLLATENLLIPKKVGVRPIVFDIGWHSIRVGYAGAERPELVVPSVKGVVKELFRDTTTAKQMKNGTLCCEVADEYAEICKLRPPLRRGIDEISDPEVIEWDDLNEIIEYIYSRLGVKPEIHPVVIVEAWPNCPFEDRSRLVQLFFDTYKVPYISLLPQAPLVLAAYGLLNGLVLDIGESFARAVPVFDGNALANASTRSPVAGLEVTQQTMRTLTFDGFKFGSFANAGRTDGFQTGKSWLERRAAGVLKEKLCYVSENVRKSVPMVRAVDAKSLPIHLQPTLQVSSNAEFVNWSKHRFEITECMFNPSLIRGDQYYAEGSLQSTVMSAISQLPPAIQRSMYAYVFVTGGTSVCPGLPKRLYNEIKDSIHASYDVRVIAPAGRENAAWRGGSILAARHDFIENLCVSKDVYNTSGLGATLEHVLEMSGLSLEGTSSYTSVVVDDEHKATSSLQQLIKASIRDSSSDAEAREKYDKVKSTITALQSMTATFLQNMKDVQDCHNQIDRVKDELARSKSKWAAADRVRCKAAASACKARLKRAEQTANTLRKELADQKKMAELLNDDKSLF